MAEEYYDQQPAQEQPAFSQADLESMIQRSVQSSLQGAFENALQQARPQAPPPPQAPPVGAENPFAEWLNPGLQQANLAAAAAADLATFYGSEEWQDMDEFLIGDSAEDRKKEKSQMRADIERYFQDMLRAGKPIVRSDIAKFVVGQKLTKDRSAYQESIGKKAKARADDELRNARRRVDISGGQADFDPREIYKMSHEEVVKKFGDISF